MNRVRPDDGRPTKIYAPLIHSSIFLFPLFITILSGGMASFEKLGESSSNARHVAEPLSWRERPNYGIPSSVVLIVPSAGALGLMIGIARGAQQARLQFLAENAHRPPTTVRGWVSPPPSVRVLLSSAVLLQPDEELQDHAERLVGGGETRGSHRRGLIGLCVSLRRHRMGTRALRRSAGGEHDKARRRGPRDAAAAYLATRRAPVHRRPERRDLVRCRYCGVLYVSDCQDMSILY